MILFNPCIELDDTADELTDEDCDKLLDDITEAITSVIEKSEFSEKMRIIR